MFNVVVYTSPGCMPCRATVRKLNALHIPHSKVDVTRDAEALDLIKRRGFKESPVVHALCGGEDLWWSGYRPAHIEELAEALAEWEAV